MSTVISAIFNKKKKDGEKKGEENEDKENGAKQNGDTPTQTPTIL